MIDSFGFLSKGIHSDDGSTTSQRQALFISQGILDVIGVVKTFKVISVQNKEKFQIVLRTRTQ
jgi:hypothetical protein